MRIGKIVLTIKKECRKYGARNVLFSEKIVLVFIKAPILIIRVLAVVSQTN